MSSSLAKAVKYKTQEYLFDALRVGARMVLRSRLGVIPAVEPIAHPKNGIDEKPWLAFDDLTLLLASANEFDEAVIVAGHHSDEFVLALA